MKPFRILITMALTHLLINCNNGNTVAGLTPIDSSGWPSADNRTVKSGLNHPWEILWGKDDHIWMTERPGRISKLNPKTGTTVFSANVEDVVDRGEGGLLGMVHHPDFLSNGLLYIVYNYNSSSGYKEKVVRLKFANNKLNEPFVLLENIPASSIHNGSRLLISPDNKLIITTGDASNSSTAQTLSTLSGKILRINLDGTIPADNPISGNPVWSFGHRNPQGIVLINEKIYTSEHGPSVEDEVNIIQKGRNFGWPEVTGPCNGDEQNFCNANNVATPIWSSGGSTVAVAGIDYYNNDRIGRWKNSILMTSLKDETLFQLKLNSSGAVESVAEFYKSEWGRLRDVCVSPEGRVYICTSNGGGNDRILEIQR